MAVMTAVNRHAGVPPARHSPQRLSVAIGVEPRRRMTLQAAPGAYGFDVLCCGMRTIDPIE